MSPLHKNISRLYGLLKTHQSNVINDIPITPVVSFVGSPIYKLLSSLNCSLKEIIKPQFKHTINNYKNFIERTKDVIGDDCLVFSLDVKNRHTNVPKKEVLQLLNDSSLSKKRLAMGCFLTVHIHA